MIAADEPPVSTKPLSDPIVVEDVQNDGSLSNPASTNQSDWGEAFCEMNDLLDQLAATKEDPRRWRWQFPRRTRWKCETLYPSDVENISSLQL